MKKSPAANAVPPLPPVPVTVVPPVPVICASAPARGGEQDEAGDDGGEASDLSDVRSNMRGSLPAGNRSARKMPCARSLVRWAGVGIGAGLAGVRQGLCHFVRETG